MNVHVCMCVCVWGGGGGGGRGEHKQHDAMERRKHTSLSVTILIS